MTITGPVPPKREVTMRKLLRLVLVFGWIIPIMGGIASITPYALADDDEGGFSARANVFGTDNSEYMVAQSATKGDFKIQRRVGPSKAGSATCEPAGTALCAGFEGGCGFVGGGMSTEPDGGVTCSVARTKRAALKKRLKTSVGGIERSSEDATCRSDGSETGNEICRGFALGCSNLGCGPSTEPDGRVRCKC